jgi:hypothetical protein
MQGDIIAEIRDSCEIQMLVWWNVRRMMQAARIRTAAVGAVMDGETFVAVSPRSGANARPLKRALGREERV